MKKIISLIIISIIIKGYLNTCQVEGTSCIGEVEGTTKCEYNEGTCIEKYYCDKIIEPNKENCEGAITLNPDITRCIFNTEQEECEIKELCLLKDMMQHKIQIVKESKL